MSEEEKKVNQPTILTIEDIDKFVEKLKKSEIRLESCRKCGDEHLPNYGGHIGECDECWFSRFPKEDVQKFYRSFFE